GHDGGLGGQQRHGLTLHVCTHQSTVGVVVLQEGDHGGSHGHHHLGGHVHVVHLVEVHLDDLVAVTAGHTAVEEGAILTHGLGGLGHVELVIHIGGHVFHLVGDTGGHALAVLVIDALHLAVGGLDEAIAVDAGVGGQ